MDNDLLDKLIQGTEEKINSLDNTPVDLKEYNLSDEDYEKASKLLLTLMGKSKLFFWIGYKEALQTIKKIENK